MATVELREEISVERSELRVDLAKRNFSVIFRDFGDFSGGTGFQCFFSWDTFTERFVRKKILGDYSGETGLH